MPLILSVDYDRRQTGALASLVRDRLHAELVQATSARDGFDALAGRVPDLILTPHLLSPKDESLISARLRDLGPAAAHVQTLTAPALRTPSKREAPARARGVLASLRRERRRRVADESEGCDPEEFAEQVRQYLETAAAQKQAIEASARQSDMDAESDQATGVADPGPWTRHAGLEALPGTSAHDGTTEPPSWPEAATTDDAAIEPVPDAPSRAGALAYAVADADAPDRPAADDAGVELQVHAVGDPSAGMDRGQAPSEPGDHPLDALSEDVVVSDVVDGGPFLEHVSYAPEDGACDAGCSGEAFAPTARGAEPPLDVPFAPDVPIESVEPEEASPGAIDVVGADPDHVLRAAAAVEDDEYDTGAASAPASPVALPPDDGSGLDEIEPAPALEVETAAPPGAPVPEVTGVAPEEVVEPRAVSREDSGFGNLYTDTPADQAWASRTTQPIDALAIPAIPGEAPVPVVDLMAYGDLDAIAQGFAAPEAASFETAFGADGRDPWTGRRAKARHGHPEPPQPEADASSAPTSTPPPYDAETPAAPADDLVWSPVAPVADTDDAFVLAPPRMDGAAPADGEDAGADAPARCIYTSALPLVAVDDLDRVEPGVATPETGEIACSPPASAVAGAQLAPGETAAAVASADVAAAEAAIVDASAADAAEPADGADEQALAISPLAVVDPEIDTTAVVVAAPEASAAAPAGPTVEDASLDPDDVIEISLDDVEEAPGARVAWARAISVHRAADVRAGALEPTRETAEPDVAALPPAVEATAGVTDPEASQPTAPMAYATVETAPAPVATALPATGETEPQAADDDATSAAAIRASYRRFDRHRPAPLPEVEAAPAAPGVAVAPVEERRSTEREVDAPAAAVPAETRRAKAARTKGPVVPAEAAPADAAPSAPDAPAAATEDSREPEARARRERRVRQTKKSSARAATRPHEPAPPIQDQAASAADDTAPPAEPAPSLDASGDSRATRPDVPLEVIADFMTGIDEALTAPPVPAPAGEHTRSASPAVLDDEALSMIGDAALKLLDTPILKEFWLGLTGDEPEPEAAPPPPEVVAAAQPAPEPEPEAVPVAAPVAAPTPAPPAPPPAPVVPPLVTEPERPAEDEWGIFDPSQAGFAALAERLDAKAAAAAARKRAR